MTRTVGKNLNYGGIGPGETDDWLTPPHILEALGPFDLDPCTSLKQLWPTARRMLTIVDDGLSHKWSGRVWCNPPYSQLGIWLERLAAHGNGIALTFARTNTPAFEKWVWPFASGLLFLYGRLCFRRAIVYRKAEDGEAPAPSVLIAYGEDNFGALARCGLAGALVRKVN